AFECDVGPVPDPRPIVLDVAPDYLACLHCHGCHAADCETSSAAANVCVGPSEHSGRKRDVTSPRNIPLGEISAVVHGQVVLHDKRKLVVWRTAVSPTIR